MTMLRSAFTNLFASRLAFLMRVFYEELGKPDDQFAGIFNVIPSRRFREDMTGLTGFGLPQTKEENESLAYDAIKPTFNKSFTHTTYALGFQISKEAKADDIDGPLNDLTRALARSMATGKAKNVWKAFNNAFTTEVTPDSQAVFANSHTLYGPEGGTFDNLVSAELAIASLRTAVNMFDDMVDDRNLEVVLDPTLLVFPSELRWIVGEILKSDLKPDTANNAINVMQGILNPIQVRWLTGATSWFVGTGPGKTGVYLVNRQDDEFDADMDFDTKSAKESCDHRYSFGWADWRGWIGGKP